MIWAILAAASSLGGFQTGQTFAQATEVTQGNGEVLKFSEKRGRWSLYAIQRSTGEYAGNIGFCDGRVWNVAVEIKSYPIFAILLRQRVSEWGQPEISFPIVSQSDDAKSSQEIKYHWPAQRYDISVNADIDGASFGTQFLSGPMATCAD